MGLRTFLVEKFPSASFSEILCLVSYWFAAAQAIGVRILRVWHILQMK